MSDLQFLKISERAYKFIRQFAIKSVEDGLIELITNCVDAYNKGKIANKKIDIIYARPNKLMVIDNAIGLTAAQMETCFLQVGEKTQTNDARGFFSRGAKDISALGDVTFSSIKDGKYSECFINKDAYGCMNIAEADVMEEQRTKYRIPENGLCVTIDLIDTFKNINIKDLANKLSKLVVLREVAFNKWITLSEYDVAGKLTYCNTVSYEYPKGKVMLEMEYIVPNYPGIKASFTIYKTDEPILQAPPQYMEHGFVVRSNTTIFENTILNDQFRLSPYINYMYGTIKCQHIDVMLRDYDVIGPTPENPSPIIDPSRTTGLNQKHPFIVALMSIPKTRVDLLLQAMNAYSDRNSFNMAEMTDLMNELKKCGLDIFKNENIQVRYNSSYTVKLNKTVADDRKHFVIFEKNYLNHETDKDKIIQSQILKLPEDKKGQEYVLRNDELVPIGQDIVPEYKEHIYYMTENEKLVKYYQVDKNNVQEADLSEAEPISDFNISFTRDVTNMKRYTINYINGINIRINMLNPVVKASLGDAGSLDDSVNANDINIKSLITANKIVFLRELFISVFTDILLENIDAKTTVVQRHETTTRIEAPIFMLFSNYLKSQGVSV